MIEHADIDLPQQLYEVAGEFDIARGGLGYAGGVVVS